MDYLELATVAAEKLIKANDRQYLCSVQYKDAKIIKIIFCLFHFLIDLFTILRKGLGRVQPILTASGRVKNGEIPSLRLASISQQTRVVFDLFAPFKSYTILV